MINLKRHLLTIFALAFIPFLTTSCSDDNDNDLQESQPIRIPENASYLNMMNESHGKSLLGNTDVYLSDDRNFVSPAEAYIGVASWDDLNCRPDPAQLFTQMAVSPGKIYQIFPRENIHRFPGGINAVKNKSIYLCACIESWIKNRGANVAFLEKYANEPVPVQIKPEIYLKSFSEPDGRMGYDLKYPSSTMDYEIMSVTTNDNISITQYNNMLEIHTVGPVTADILIYVCFRGQIYDYYYIAQTIHITPRE